ncbi:hypothetical protein Afil01_27990 [Actinorhabdospora filicis]|uniref:Uncharacterized protein n=1 Tax=Actinorhabdospora filicis TaxID=1785913 RepID=A0A9W6W3C4_9ACTN|nr:hypothetical protein [Actinorhabdospora filicis]GLZ77992.1 hypothetical protein Afil01_27990 [Actinorhabdospora filicis]
MKKIVETAGFLLAVMGVSGAIDHLWTQPIMGGFLNAFNRYVIPHVGFVTGHELYANLSVAVLGVAVMLLGAKVAEG